MESYNLLFDNLDIVLQKNTIYVISKLLHDTRTLQIISEIKVDITVLLIQVLNNFDPELKREKNIRDFQRPFVKNTNLPDLLSVTDTNKDSANTGAIPQKHRLFRTSRPETRDYFHNYDSRDARFLKNLFILTSRRHGT